MKKNLFIFRHGQTDFNLHHIWQGCHCETTLNDTGKQQAHNLGLRLYCFNIQVIYCSPLTRAVQTACAVADLKLPPPKIEIVPDLREGDFGNAEGQKMSTLQERYSDIINDIMDPTRQTWDLRFPGDSSESKHQIFDRVMRALHEIVMNSEYNIGISTHGGVINALACGLDLKNISHENCAVLRLVYDCDTKQFTQAD